MTRYLTTQPRAMRLNTPMMTSSSLPTLPGYVFKLNQLLSERQPDMDAVVRVIRTDASLAVQTLRLANLYRLEESAAITTVANAVTALGPHRLRTLALTCPLLDCASDLPLWVRLQTFWQHNFMTATLSGSIARFLGYDSAETAYTAGLLRNIGELSLIAKCRIDSSAWPTAHESSRVLRKRAQESGRRLAIACKLTPELVEVCGCDDPLNAWHDPLLVKIVTAASRFCESNGLVSGEAPQQLMSDQNEGAMVRFFSSHFKLRTERAADLHAALSFMFRSLMGSLEFDTAGLLHVAFADLVEEEMEPAVLVSA